MIDNCTALVVAGGDSQRMGRDKATLRLGDRTLVQRVIDVVRPLFRDVVVSVRQARPDIDWPQVCDAFPNAGPLAGLCAGLSRAKENHTGWIFAVATDMPFVQAALIEQLARRRPGFQAVVPIVHGHPQALAGFYSVDCLPTMQAILSGDGRRSVRAALERLNVCGVDESELRRADPGLRSFFDLDTPDDVATAQQSKELD